MTNGKQGSIIDRYLNQGLATAFAAAACIFVFYPMFTESQETMKTLREQIPKQTHVMEEVIKLEQASQVFQKRVEEDHKRSAEADVNAAEAHQNMCDALRAISGGG